MSNYPHFDEDVHGDVPALPGDFQVTPLDEFIAAHRQAVADAASLMPPTGATSIDIHIEHPIITGADRAMIERVMGSEAVVKRIEAAALTIVEGFQAEREDPHAHGFPKDSNVDLREGL